MGVSGMTIRRWEKNTPGEELPRFYSNAVAQMTRQLITEGRLPPDSSVAVEIVAGDITAVLGQPVDKVLGLPPDFLKQAANNSDTLVVGLSQIGAKAENRREVDRSTSKILSFKTWGASWKRCISGIMTVVRSKELTLVDKLVAYGALFYLLTPLDLIPDALPGIGYLDDFAILSLALMYYERRFRHLFFT
jgi:uncharacterized membrane protein YkvA (DUF1232 family)